MRRPIKTRKDLDIASNHFLRRNPGYPLGVTLTELDYLRGHNDDFFGDQIADEYSTTLVGGSTVALTTPAHGGVCLLTSGPAAANYANLRLGGGYNTLDADEGWLMITRMRVSHTTDIAGDFGAFDGNIWNDVILVGINTAFIAANWIIVTRTGGGGWNAVNSGVAADTDWHWHAASVYPIAGGRQVDYYLDGALIASTTVSVPTVVLEPVVRVNLGAAATRYNYLDVWDVIPRNL